MARHAGGAPDEPNSPEEREQMVGDMIKLSNTGEIPKASVLLIVAPYFGQAASRRTLDAERLKAYKAKLTVFPREVSKPKKGDFIGDDLKAPTTHTDLAPPPSLNPEAPRRITKEERVFDAAKTLRDFKLRATKRDEEGINEKLIADLRWVDDWSTDLDSESIRYQRLRALLPRDTPENHDNELRLN
ncbi:hypothetical protein BDM02DRAFT_3272408 [Thelephora ganbajun]|uniref:Uncharacterized protein n=1 Tax=Thelephora ganbajun TaxID=370292 RepID=A0ACB6Z594_THEGA|nr:hypothetical protein BDM02DRAFT_3272408 [Thelephora ganbajun]